MAKEAMFGAGCFWGVEESFRHIDGVIDTAVGYAGGSTEHPSYEDVCTGTTGHAEVVHVKFDPERVSYRQLLDTFFEIHDPTTPNRQGPDVGTQYRSAVFFYEDEQEAAARETMRRLDASGAFGRPLVTQIVPAAPFWRAEEYHQRYFEKNGITHCG
ncbi:MAG: peptide-methionine (S)-S-oxide reductase MsrA [Deltaproteobacteria bacterium]|nr:peptide-methionine (S)-S-oxide reductase MsrA [Deltaproteobacteria bacterium]